MMGARRSELDGVVGAVALWASAAEVLMRFDRGEPLDDEEQRRVHLVSHAALRIGEPLLRAESEEDHLHRIGIASHDPELLDLSALGLRAAYAPSLPEALFQRATTPALARHFGHDAIPCLKDGDEYAAVILGALRHRWIHLGGQDVRVQSVDLMAFLHDPAVSEEVWRAAHHGLEAAACFTAMALVVLTRRDVRPRIAATLAERWTFGQGQFLRLLASLPGVDVSERLVPAEARFDLERLFADAAAEARQP